MNLIKISFFVFAGLMFAPVYSQRVIKKVSKEICDCMNKIDQKAKAVDLKQEIEACLMQGMMSDIEGLKKKYKIEEGDEKAITKMTEDILTRLVKTCPNARDIFTVISNSEEEGPSEDMIEEEK